MICAKFWSVAEFVQKIRAPSDSDIDLAQVTVRSFYPLVGKDDRELLIPLSGLAGGDACMLVGHDYTYKASQAGRVFEALAQAGVCDFILIFDEVYKVNDDSGGVT